MRTLDVTSGMRHFVIKSKNNINKKLKQSLHAIYDYGDEFWSKEVNRPSVK